MSAGNRLPAALRFAALLSGAAALMFETLWARALAIVLGSTVEANALIFAAFMLGLALGALAFGRLAERSKRVTRLYALVELGIGATGFGVGWVLHRHATDLARFVGPLDSTGHLASAILVALGLVGIPTSLMGATFPLLLEAARSLRGRVVDLYGIYALNTLGGAAGTLATTLLTIPAWGVTRSLIVAAGLDVAAGWLALGLSGAPTADQPAPLQPPMPESPRAFTAGERGRDWLLLGSAFASGLVVLGIEVVWFRLASFFLGNRALAFTVLVAWVLVLLAGGSWLGGRLGPRIERKVQRWLGLLWALSGALILLSAWAAYGWLDLQTSVERALPYHAALLVPYRVVETGVLLGPMILALGCIFPASLFCSSAVGCRTGSTGGRFYWVNAIGAVLGSLLTGFWGVVRLGTFAWTRVLVWVCCALAALCLGRELVRERRLGHALGLGALGLLLVLGELVGGLELGVSAGGRQPLLRREDQYGVFQVMRDSDGTIRTINNRTELVYHLGLASTSYVQQMQGHLGMVFCPDARKAVVLGSGYGITAGALGLYPAIERVDAVEIVPAMVEAAELFMPYNLGYHRNPKVRVVVDDGRHFLARASERYDIISVNVADPHLPGGSALLHAEFYATAQEHLSERGVLIQHAFGTDAATVLATLHAAFPHVLLTRGYENSFNAVASMHPLAVDAAAVRELARTPAVGQAWASIGLLAPVDVVAMLEHQAHFEVPGEADAPIATDDYPRLELSWSGSSDLWLFSNE